MTKHELESQARCHMRFELARLPICPPVDSHLQLPQALALFVIDSPPVMPLFHHLKECAREIVNQDINVLLDGRQCRIVGKADNIADGKRQWQIQG